MRKDSSVKRRIRKSWTFKILKASLKAFIILILYSLATNFLDSLIELAPGFRSTIQIFVFAFVILTMASDLTQGTIWRSILNGSKSLIVIFYFLSSMAKSIVSVTIQNITLTVDLSIILWASVFLSLFGLVSSILEAVHFLSERAELQVIN
jgi:hypothetical protein